MKATLSKDGKMRFSIAISYRVGWSDLVDALTLHFNRQEVEPVEAVKNINSRSLVIAITKHEIAAEGCSMGMSLRAGDCPEACQKAACGVVDRLFPELKQKEDTNAKD